MFPEPVEGIPTETVCMIYFVSMDTFFEIGLILALATLVSVVMQRLRLPLILGHILTGILAGPLALDLIRSKQTEAVF